jgi:NAD(P)-dependent dehydrogenase (short-subunit alcohol dehydrogenase family)
MDAAHWAEQIDTNLNGPFHTAKAAIPIMIEQGTGGAIVFTSSVAGLRGLPYLAGYVAAKHGVTGLAKTLANELAEHRIRVNTVHPHGVQTGLTVPELFPMIQDASPTLSTLYMGQLLDPVSQAEDIAAAVAWLASNEARHVTGIQLPVDLGRTNR